VRSIAADFVESVLAQAQENFVRKYRLKAKDRDVEIITLGIAEMMAIAPDQVGVSGKQSN